MRSLFDISDDLLALAALREAVEAGQEIPGCSLAERGTHLRIK